MQNTICNFLTNSQSGLLSYSELLHFKSTGFNLCRVTMLERYYLNTCWFHLHPAYWSQKGSNCTASEWILCLYFLEWFLHITRHSHRKLCVSLPLIFKKVHNKKGGGSVSFWVETYYLDVSVHLWCLPVNPDINFLQSISCYQRADTGCSGTKSR